MGVSSDAVLEEAWSTWRLGVANNGKWGLYSYMQGQERGIHMAGALSAMSDTCNMSCSLCLAGRCVTVVLTWIQPCRDGPLDMSEQWKRARSLSLCAGERRLRISHCSLPSCCSRDAEARERCRAEASSCFIRGIGVAGGEARLGRHRQLQFARADEVFQQARLPLSTQGTPCVCTAHTSRLRKRPGWPPLPQWAPIRYVLQRKYRRQQRMKAPRSP